MNKRKWADNWPSVDELTVWAKVAACGYAMSTTAGPVANILADFWPEETSAKAVQGFVFAQVTSGWGGMVCTKDIEA